MKFLIHKDNYRVYALFLLFILVYSFFIFIRPYEDDESAYILVGAEVLHGHLKIFDAKLNPFDYIMGGPAVPIIYAFLFKLGGIFLARLLCLISVVSSLFIIYKTIGKYNGNYLWPIFLLGMSVTTITIASDGYIDSFALLLLMISLYFFVEEKLFLSGAFGGASMISKYILVLPVCLFLVYLIYKKRWKNYLIGLSLIAVPYLYLFRNLFPIIIGFIHSTKLNFVEFYSSKYFIENFFISYPIVLIICLYLFMAKKIRKQGLILAAALSILLYQVLALDYGSLNRHLPYVQFLSAAVIGINVRKVNIRKALLFGFIFLYVSLNLFSSIKIVEDYPSYQQIKSDLTQVHGKVLALNPHAYLLARGMTITNLHKNVFSYFYLDYDTISPTSIEVYKTAIRDNYFDFAIVSSYSPPEYSRYREIEDSIRKYYCPVKKSSAPNGLDIYRICNSKVNK